MESIASDQWSQSLRNETLTQQGEKRLFPKNAYTEQTKHLCKENAAPGEPIFLINSFRSFRSNNRPAISCALWHSPSSGQHLSIFASWTSRSQSPAKHSHLSLRPIETSKHKTQRMLTPMHADCSAISRKLTLSSCMLSEIPGGHCELACWRHHNFRSQPDRLSFEWRCLSRQGKQQSFLVVLWCLS